MALNINLKYRLSEDQYFHIPCHKTGICLHHTIGGSALSTFEYWQRSPEMVGAAYLIERDGTIFEVFDPQFWAFQFGVPWNDNEKIMFEKRFIGIEIASEGGLIEYQGELYCFERISERTRKNRDEAFDYGQFYRGYRYFDRYEPQQIDSVIALVNELCDRFRIERNIPAEYLGFHDKKLIDFKGIIGHINVRYDKTDPAPDVSFWEKVITECNLKKITLVDEIEALFNENVQQFSKMNRTAASIVKGLLYELQRGDRNTYIKLYDAEENGHTVFYQVVRGDPELVKRVAAALGFKTVTDNKLEVYHD